MRTYYLFGIKKEVYECYKNSAESLYRTLEKLHMAPLENYNYALSVYHQLCNIIDTKRLEEYFDEKEFPKKNKQYFFHNSKNNEKTRIEIKPSYIKITTNKNISALFQSFYYYNQHMFVCDFKEKDYFWLKNCRNIQKVLT